MRQMSNILCFLHGWTKNIPIVSKDWNNDEPGRHSILDSDYYIILIFEWNIGSKYCVFCKICVLWCINKSMVLVYIDMRFAMADYIFQIPTSNPNERKCQK